MVMKRGPTVLATGGVDSLHGPAGWNGARQTDGSGRQLAVVILVAEKRCKSVSLNLLVGRPRPAP